MPAMRDRGGPVRLALKLQRRASLAGFAINAAGAASLGLYMLVVFPPEGASRAG